MKEEYTQKVAFLHGLQPWTHNAILQRSEVPMTYQEMMKVVQCMEDDFVHKKVGTLQSLATHNEGEHREHNTYCKWPKEGPKNKVEQKST